MNHGYHFMTESANMILELSKQMVTNKQLKSKEVMTIGSSLSREYDKLSQASLSFVQQEEKGISKRLRESVLCLGQLCLDLIKSVGDIEANNEVNQNTIFENKITTHFLDKIAIEINEILLLLNSMTAMPRTKRSCYANTVKEIENILNSSYVMCFNGYESVSDEGLQAPLKSTLKETWVLYQLLKMVVANIVSSDCETVAISLQNLQCCLAKIAHYVRNFVLIAKIEDYKDILASMEESFLCIINFLIICEEIDEITNIQHNKNLLKSSCTKSVEGIRMFVKEISKQENNYE